MKNTAILTVLSMFFIITSCETKPNQVSNKADYDKYLNKEDKTTLAFVSKEINFWEAKFKKAPNQMSYLSIIASNYSTKFDITANIDYLLIAEDCLVKYNESLNYTEVNPLRSLARNYISQHRFKEALTLANKAKEIGEGIDETNKLLFDVQMELGNYQAAESSLNALKVKGFDYYIRVAKWNDYLGDLKTTISLMHKATAEAEKYDNKGLKLWCYTNLGDFYGHAGQIKESYDNYLKALELEPNNSYSLKGIAWIVFSHEKNTVEAKRIIAIISKRHNSPDFYLLKAEIAEYENNAKEQKENLDKYATAMKTGKYGAMYNKYNAILYAEDKNKVAEAVEIAKVEIEHRPTPVSYDLLAWSYYNAGEKEKALEIANKYVDGKSFEPELNYHLAVIYKANNQLDKVKSIKKDLMNSLYELGPNYESKIKSL
jgi:tetratricopeptide (TPR) repeat protein